MKNNKKSKKKNSKVVVAVSGGFDPVHVGHVRLFNEAKKLGDELVVVINNDNWLQKKKGFVFMPEKERRELIAAFRAVDRVMLTVHKQNDPDRSVCRELRKIRPHIFANGGDRFAHNVPEVGVCKEIGCRIVFRVGRGGKVQSSSWLVDRVIERAFKRR